jgi:hypothetical protein
VPEGQRGRWKVERFEVSKEEERLERIRAFSNAGRFVPQGTYTRLTRDGRCIMSDTPDEISDHFVLRQFSGRVLIHGLGLGMALSYLLRKQGITAIDLVEIDTDVISLVGQHFQDPRLTIWEGDAYTFRFPDHASRRWEHAWHDIWDDICSDNLEGMKKLHRRYGSKVLDQHSWCRWRCERDR